MQIPRRELPLSCLVINSLTIKLTIVKKHLIADTSKFFLEAQDIDYCVIHVEFNYKNLNNAFFLFTEKNFTRSTNGLVYMPEMHF